MSNQNICNICGANYEYRNGRWKCPACGAYKAEELSNEEVTLFYNAAQKLRLCDFDEAEKAYTDIIEKFPKNANGYWGRLLSRYGIKYEEDFDGRKIPTCYAASIESVLSDKDYHKALELADADTKAYFDQQAQYIERVRKEWIERAKKEKPYDIFICYKDSDLANGIDRTQDSIAAQDLYIHLTEQGYRVFFSRESLRDKVGEKYEPYIFNALSTAKVMLVYGTSSDYITSTWLKNEWTRYEKRLQAGEKKPNSLIVACDGFSPAELPKALSSMQCFDATKRSFYTDLDVVLKKIIKGEGKPKPVTKENKEKKKSKKIPVAIATISALIAVFLCILIPNLLNTQPVTSIVDSKYGVVITAQEGVFDKNTAVNVERLSDGTQYESLVSAVNDSKSIELQNAVIYDINCDADIDTNVTVKVPYAKDKADSMVKVYYVSDDKSTVEEHSCTYDNGSVEFKTTHFSYYVVGEIVTENDDSSDNQDKNNDNQNSSSIGGENTGDDITPPPPEGKEATINFNANGGSGSMSEQTVTVGKSTNLKECSYTKSGYIFSGWATSTGGSVVYTDGGAFVIESEEEIILYAIWVPNTNSLVFNSNGGSGAMNTISIKTDETIALPVNTFNKTGYTFIGWSNVQNGSVVYNDGQSFSMTSSATITLYAVWSANINTINFNANGGSGTMSPMYIKTDARANLTRNNFTRAGYIFVGWSTSPTGIMQYLDEASYTMGADATTTLYAVWTANTNTLYFNANGGEGSMSPMYIQTNSQVQLTENSFTRNGYDFAGWATSPSGSVVYEDKSTYIMGTNSSNTLYAVWNVSSTIETQKFTYTQPGSGYYHISKYNGTEESVTLPTEYNGLPVTGIDANAFFACTTLRSVTIPANITFIDQGAFSSCSNLENAYFAITSGWANVTEMGKFICYRGDLSTASGAAFQLKNTDADLMWMSDYYSDGLTFIKTGDTYSVSSYSGTDTQVIIPATYNGLPVTKIGDNAFKNCIEITSIIIPNSVISIGNEAFWACHRLMSITIPNSITSIGNNAFLHCEKLIEVINHSSLTFTVGSSNYGCIAAYAKKVHTGTSQIVNKDGYLFYTHNSVNYLLGYNGIISELDLPNDYDGQDYEIYCSAFYEYSNITSITIPNSVTNIGQDAFRCCGNLTYITIPNSVTSIGYSAFCGCTGLTSITIPNSLTSIDRYAFYGCSDLTVVFFTGNESERAQIDISTTGNDYLRNASWYYYSDSQPTDSNYVYWHYVDGIPTKW